MKKEQYINIPYSIMMSKNLSQTEKMIYGFICGFDFTDNICYVSNRYIGEVIGVSERTASRAITKLVTTSLVSRFEEGGRKRWLTTTKKTPSTSPVSTNHDTNVYPTTTLVSNNNIVDNINNNIVNTIKEEKEETKGEDSLTENISNIKYIDNIKYTNIDGKLIDDNGNIFITPF